MGHGVQVITPDKEKLPAGHGVTLEGSDGLEHENPAGHGEHELEPSALNVP